ncbi:MAG: helix-turn-helix transcriptional regulator [Hyphomicrobiaceae bacterium]
MPITERAHISLTARALAVEGLWGAKAIARFLGVSQDTVRAWARDPQVPIFKPPGSRRLFALRSELLRWLRTSV